MLFATRENCYVSFQRLLAASFTAWVSWTPCALAVSPHAPTAAPQMAPNHAEPLLFDLVRRLNVERGEREWGTLFQVKGDEIEYATEFEWASDDGQALEIEVGNVHTPERFLKGAVQSQLGSALHDKLLHGLHLAGGLEPTEGRGHWTLSHITSYRFNPTWSAMVIAGGRGEREKNETSWATQLNGCLFADLSEEFILGAETNWRQTINGVSQLEVVPQLRWDQAEGFHVQFGIGAALTGGRISPLTALRVNHAF